MLVIQDELNNGFGDTDIGDLLDIYAKGNSDFNNLLIVELCKKHKLTLVTDDGDFEGQDIGILTANKRLLA